MSAPPAISLTVSIDAGELEALASWLMAKLNDAQRPDDSDPWLTADQAAHYIGAPRSRIYDLKAQRAIRFSKDGGRLLFRRSWLDAYLSDASEPPSAIVTPLSRVAKVPMNVGPKRGPAAL